MPLRVTTFTTDPALLPLLKTYDVPEGHFDELRGPESALRPAWQTFAAAEPDVTAVFCAQAEQRIAHTGQAATKPSHQHLFIRTRAGRQVPKDDCLQNLVICVCAQTFFFFLSHSW